MIPFKRQGAERFRVRSLLWAAVLLAVLGAGAGASENRGAPEILLEGGSRGKVPFTHLEHQNRLDDCMVCHAAFAQEKGSIEALKAQGKLARQEIMNQQCLKCHRARRNAGQAAGPVTCAACHKKE